jgi:hypothetical protein
MAFILLKKLYLSSKRTWNRFKKINALVKAQISREGQLQGLIPEPVLTKSRNMQFKYPRASSTLNLPNI